MWQVPLHDPWLGPRVALPPPGPTPPSIAQLEADRAELEVLSSRLATRIEELSASLAVLDVLDERLTKAQTLERAAGASGEELKVKAVFSAIISLARDQDAASKERNELRSVVSAQREKIAELTASVGRLTTEVVDRNAGDRPKEEAARKTAEALAVVRSELAAAEAVRNEASQAKERFRREADSAREAAEEARADADRERTRRQAAEGRLDSARSEADAAATTAAETVRAAELQRYMLIKLNGAAHSYAVIQAESADSACRRGT